MKNLKLKAKIEIESEYSLVVGIASSIGSYVVLGLIIATIYTKTFEDAFDTVMFYIFIPGIMFGIIASLMSAFIIGLKKNRISPLGYASIFTFIFCLISAAFMTFYDLIGQIIIHQINNSMANLVFYSVLSLVILFIFSLLAFLRVFKNELERKNLPESV